VKKIKVFMAIVATAFLFSLDSFAVKKKNLDVFKEFNKKIEQLEKSVSSEKDKSKRYELFLRSYIDLSSLRSNNPRQTEGKELNMSMYMDSLSFLPEKKEYEANKCHEYQNKVTTMMKAYDPENKEPYVKKALDLIDLLCR
jgi:hypothetical protein